MQQMQQTAVANRARLRDEAQKSFRSLLQADPIANDALQSGVSDLQSQIVAENVNLSPESIPVAWDDPRSKVTVARLASVGANREVFNELVNFVASRDEEEVGALREAVSSTDFGPDPQAAKTVHDALTSMIGHAEDVAYLTKPWEEPSDAPFNGNPKAFGFVSSVGLDNIGQVDSLPEVAAAVSAGRAVTTAATAAATAGRAVMTAATAATTGSTRRRSSTCSRARTATRRPP